jgi:transcription elongation GreA/GreB family factor
MAETTADVRRDIELTRNRISDTLEELEHKLNVTQLVKDNPWPALALAVGAGVLLSGSRADVKAAAATVTATRGASGRVGTVLDELVSQVVQSFQGVVEQRIEGLANEVKRAIGAPVTPRNGGVNVGTNVGMNTNTSLGFQQGAGDGLSSAPRAD